MSTVKATRPKKTRPAPGVINPKLADFTCDLVEGTVSVENTGGIYDWKMHVGEFKPEEIKIKITSRNVVIEATAETEEEVSEFSQEVVLPDGVHSETMECTVNTTGILRLRAAMDSQPLNSTTKIVASSKRTEQVMTETTTESSVRTEEEEVEEEESIVETQVSDTDPVLDSRYVDSSKDIAKKGDKFELAFDMHEFEKKDLKITVHNSVVTVEAKSKPKKSTGRLPKEAYQMFGIPDGTKPGSIKSTFKNGQLVISGQTLQLSEAEKKKIKRTRQQVQQQTFLGPRGLGLKQDVPVETIVDTSKEEDPTDLKEITKQITYENFDGSKFEVQFDVAGFRPEEVKVKVFKNMITIRGEQKLENGEFNKNSQFYKKFTFPKGCRAETIQSTFTRNGMLRIAAPIQKGGGVTIEEISSVQNQEPQQVAILKPKIMKSDATFESQQVEMSNMQVGPDEGRNFQRTIDISGYEPKDINVTIKNGWITVTGKQVKGVFDAFSDFRNRQFSRQFTVPHGVKPEEIQFAVTKADKNSALTISVAPN